MKKTVEELAAIYTTLKHIEKGSLAQNYDQYDVESAFIAGHNKAQEWIDIKSPPDNGRDVLVKSEVRGSTTYHVRRYNKYTYDWNYIGRQIVRYTHWREI